LFFESIDKVGQEPKLSELLAALREALENKIEADILAARVNIARYLRASIVKMRIAAAGSQPPATECCVDVRRNHPARFVEVTFLGKKELIFGPPIRNLVKTEPKIPSAVIEALGITPRQAELTSLLAMGIPLKEVAAKLGVSFETARWHLREIFRKTETRSQDDLVELAKRSFRQLSGVRAPS
jgi:DNA-binding CsgD family transcriptional regulator